LIISVFIRYYQNYGNEGILFRIIIIMKHFFALVCTIPIFVIYKKKVLIVI